MAILSFKSDHVPIRVAYWVVRKVLGPIIKLIWVKDVTGLHNIPRRGPVIVAFNHQSYFDFISFIAVSPRNVHFLSAEKFFKNKLWRPIMLLTGQIKVERTSKDKRVVHSTVSEHLRRGMMIGIFPEGTRSPHPDEMLPAYPGVAKYAIWYNVPVIPVGIRGAYEVMSKFDKKPRFRRMIEIVVGEPMDFEKYREVKMNKIAYRVLTNEIMTTISGLCGRTCQLIELRSKRKRKK